MRKFVSLFLMAQLGSVAWSVQAPPKMLIFQTLAPVEDGRDFNIRVLTYFASTFEEEGRVHPIAWSLADPTFRKAAEDKIIAISAENAKPDEVLDAAQKLDCGYVFFVSALRHGDQIIADARLFKGRRQIWKDNRMVMARIDDAMSAESGARSLARTWMMQLNQSEFKNLVPKPIVRTPQPDPGTAQTPPIPEVISTPKPPLAKVDNSTVRAESDRLFRLGETRAAVQVLREAVDAEPLDEERRVLLVEALLRTGQHEEAAEEAQRAAELFPTAPSFWRVCARASMEAGNVQDALRNLNEAVSRDPDHPETRLLLGQVHLLNGRPDFAVEHFEEVLKKGPNPVALLLRGCAHQLGGNAAQAQKDFAEATPFVGNFSAEQKQSLHAYVFQLLLLQGQSQAVQVRDLTQRVRQNVKLPAHSENVKVLAGQMDALLRLSALVAPPESKRKAHETVVLALKLLVQSLSEVRQHLASPADDMLTDATITLGEAMRALEDAKKSLVPAS